MRQYPERLSTGKWRDVNGNTHNTLKQACKSQASAEGASERSLRVVAEFIEVEILNKL